MSEVSFAFPPGDRPSAAIHGSGQRFPIHRIYCVGQNYADHAREMGADPLREPPFFFSKPADAVFTADATADTPTPVAYPARTTDFQHEIELVVALVAAAATLRRQTLQLMFSDSPLVST
jgi:fumarylpyruvate hydrolase